MEPIEKVAVGFAVAAAVLLVIPPLAVLAALGAIVASIVALVRSKRQGQSSRIALRVLIFTVAGLCALVVGNALYAASAPDQAITHGARPFVQSLPEYTMVKTRQLLSNLLL